MDSPYYLLLRYDAPKGGEGAVVCGTHRAGVDDPRKLRTAQAHVNVDFDEYRLAREPGEWRFRPGKGLYKK